eukprot:gene1551-1688_t
MAEELSPSSSSQHQYRVKPYDFWQSIGSPRLVVAPMVDNSELAYRMLTRKYGAQLVYTQMFNASIFVQSKENRKKFFTTCPEDRPLFVQFAGHNPQELLKAAKFVEDQCDAVDLNLGCPQGIAKRGRYGAFLMEELELLSEMVSTLAQGLSIPVTCKTRIYDDYERSIRLCETLVKAGASVLTIHGRTREEKGHLVGPCNWYMIARIKEHFAQYNPPIPIIANGGIETYEDVLRCLAITKADAVMSSEAILENPALFLPSRCLDPLPSNVDVITLTEEYLALCQQYPVWHFKILRSHVLKMLYRYINENSDIRDLCSRGHSIETFLEVCRTCREYAKTRSLVGEDGSIKPWISWYQRHRQGGGSTDVLQQICQPEHRKARHDPDHLLDLSGSFQRGDAWDCPAGEGDDDEAGGIFCALNMFSE